MSKQMSGDSLDITQENIQKIKELFPEVLTEGKIDFDLLRTVLGEEVEDNNERYSFTWNGKKKAILGAQKPSKGTLRPDEEKSKNFDTTENLYIEGDNLEVLKLLQKSYNNKIKIIYIDPPYNTGNDFVYKDDFKKSIDIYLEQTGQVDRERNRLSTNTENNGRFHTDWLNMMYSRLKLARNLLTSDGVVFISIDDSEQSRLKMMCDEIFGEINFIAEIIHKNNSNKNQTQFIGVSTEYILVYARSLSFLRNENREWRIPKKGSADIVKYFEQAKSKGMNLEDILSDIKDLYKRPKYSHLSRWNKIDSKGIFKDENISREGGPKNFTIINPKTGKECAIPPRGWGKNYQELLKLQKEDMIYYGDENSVPGIKYYLKSDTVSVPDNFWFFDNSVDVRWIKTTFGSYIFENPKPLEMLKQILILNSSKNDIILDFFSGSATTAHATMQLNAEDGGNRKFIMVQLPEPLDEKSVAYKDGYHTICDIGEERIRRAGEKIKAELKEKQEKAGMLDENIVDPESLDIGFKVLKLDKSNIREWNADFNNIGETMDLFEDVFVEGRSELDVVYEIMLKNGLELSYPVNTFQVNGKNIYDIAYGNLFICLDDNIDCDIARAIIRKRDEYGIETSTVVLKDAGFNGHDSEKLNCFELLKDAGYPEDNLLTI